MGFGLGLLSFVLAVCAVISLFALAPLGPGYTFSAFLFGIPIVILVVAVLPAFRKIYSVRAPDSGGAETQRQQVREYCFGGLTYPCAVTSSVGSHFTNTMVLSAIIFAMYMGGSASFIGWFVCVLLFYPLLLVALIASPEVRRFFDERDSASIANCTVVRFIGSNYGPRSFLLIRRLFLLALVTLLFVEMSFVLLWSNALFESRFSDPWIIGVLWFLITFAYVYLGGFRQVLITDWFQFVLLTLLFLTLAVVALYTFRADTTLLTALGDIFGTWLDDTRLKEDAIALKAIGAIDRAEIAALPLEASIWSGLASALLLAGWFVAGPDMWNRLLHLFYVVPLRHGRKPSDGRTIMRFAFMVGGILGCLALLSGYVGSYGFAHAHSISIDAAHPQTAFYPIVEHQINLTSDRLRTELPMWFPSWESSNTFVQAIVLLVICLLCMTTIDTMLVTGVQFYQDRFSGDEDATAATAMTLDLARSYAGLLFIIAVGATLTLFVAFPATFPVIVVWVAALSTPPLLTAMIVILCFRVFAPTFLQNRDRLFVSMMLSAFLLFAIASVFCFITRPDYGVLNFAYGTRGSVASILIIEIICFALAFCVGAIVAKLTAVVIQEARRPGKTAEHV